MSKNNINDYTVRELMEKYKDIIGDDIENFLCGSIYNEKKYNVIKENISRRTLRPTDKKERVRASYEILYEMLEEEKLNTDINLKKQVLSEILKKYSNTIKARTRKEMKELILEGRDFEIYMIPNEKYEGLFKYEITTREEPKDIESIYDKREKTLFKQVIERIEISDLENLLKPEYRKEILDVIMKEASQEYFLNRKKMSIEEYKNLYKEGKQEDEDEIVIKFDAENAETEINQIIIEYLKRNFHFVDKEALLLNAAAKLMLGIRVLQGEEIDNVSINEINESEKQDKISRNIIELKEINRELNKNKYKGIEYTIKDKDEKEIISVTKEKLRGFLERCTDSKYISPEQIKQIHENIKKGILPEDSQELVIAEVEKEDVFGIVQNYKKSQNKEEKEKMLESAEFLLNYLKQNKKINNEEIIESYINGDLNIELINLMDTTELSDEYFNEKLLNIFGENVYLNNEETNEKAKRFGELYAILKEKKQINISTDKIVEKLSKVFGEEFISGIIDDLYKMKIVNVKEALQWLGGEFITEQYKQEKLEPVEIRNLYDNGIIKHDELISMIKLLEDNTQKFMVISSLFPEQESTKIRQELSEKCLNLVSERKEKKGIRREENEYDKRKEYNKYVTDPVARFMLFALLDKNYSFKLALDGHAIIHMPNYEKVIIEKMLDKNGRPYYGAATYVLDEDFFEKNRNMLINENKIRRSKLIENLSSNHVEKVIHLEKGWGKGIEKVFGINEGTKTPEELKQIEEAIEAIEASRTKMKEE